MRLKSVMPDCRSLQSRETNDPSQTPWIKSEGGELFIALIERSQLLAIDHPSKLAYIF
jgi:hypothetical protein